MTDKLISADKLARNFQSKIWFSRDEVLDAIADAESVEGELVRHGVWINHGHVIGTLKHPWSEDWECSVCGYVAYVLLSEPGKICPNCGARMDGVGDADN